MLLELEDVPVERPDALKDAVAVEKPVVEDGDLRLGFRDEVPVQVDSAVRAA